MRNLSLGIDTTGGWCSVAIVDDARILSHQFKAMRRGHAEHLGLMCKSVLADAKLTINNITKICVCSGPGSFTGQRVGMSFAKGLALPHNIPIVGISNLEVWAFAANPEQNQTILACADVRRNQVFWQIFKNGHAKSTPRLSEYEFAKEHIEDVDMCVGNGAHLLGNFEQHNDYVCAASLAWIGIDRDPITHPAEPIYHRPPDAKLPGGKTLKTKI